MADDRHDARPHEAPAAGRHDDTELLLRRQRARAAAPGAAEPPRPIWGLALSGGGIRSATLSLGVLQAIAATPMPPAGGAPANAHDPASEASGAVIQGAAKPRPPRPTGFDRSLLSRFDILSTVSGGGYAGAFLVSLFLPGRLRTPKQAPATAQTAADDAIEVLCNDPPGRVRADTRFSESGVLQAPLAWLRDNGRYLSPSGGGDMFYAISLALRNWVAVHYVLGTVLMSVFAFAALGSAAVPALNVLEQQHLQQALAELAAKAPGWQDGWWRSPLFFPALLLLTLWPLPSGLAFWLPQPSGKAGLCKALNSAFWGLSLVLVLVALAATWGPTLAAGGLPSPTPARALACVAGSVPGVCAALVHGLAREPLWVLWLVALLGLLHYLAVRTTSADVDLLRVRLTRSLTYGLIAAGALAGLAVVDTAAHTFYLEITLGAGKLSSALTPAGLTGILIWAVRKFALTSDGAARPAWLGKIPMTWLGGIAGIGIMVVIATAWAMVILLMQWRGDPPDPHQLGQQQPLLGLLFVGALVLTVISGWFPSFINLSSLQSFYSSRLTRAYLGATNGLRFPAEDTQRSSVAQPDGGDAVLLSEFVRTDSLNQEVLTTRAPLHLINCTINATVDPGEQLVQRDRKGLPLVVTPRGFAIDGAPPEPFTTATPNIELQRTLSLGQWIGTSGAAFSTGIGRETSLGLSMLMGVANVRLGTWWPSGSRRLKPPGLVARAIEFGFRTQSYLFDEFTAQFHGLRRSWQYLSDGGHFENTALYELLRPSRETRFAIACDHGADPDYRFDDLANLIRLVRIDMQVELQVDAGVAADPVLAPWLGVPSDFRSPLGAARDLAAGRPAKAPTEPGDEPPVHEPVGLLLRACHGQPARTTAWVLLLKPRVRTDSAADVVQYALGNPTFPQQPTADQFFDEAQWESYRKLGHDNASHLLDATVWAALMAYVQRGGPPEAVARRRRRSRA